MAKKFHFRRGKRQGPQPFSPQRTASGTRDEAAGGQNQLGGTARKLKLEFRPTLSGAFKFLREFTVFLRNSLVWGVFALFTAGLILTMMSGQTPWDIFQGRPPASSRTAVRVWSNEQQQYGPDRIVAVGDDRSLLAVQLSQTTGNTLRIDAGGDVSKSLSVLFKDYSIFLWADNRSSTWLHRGNKLIQKFDNSGELLWQRQLDFWPETSWCSSDGYILVGLLDADLNQTLVLFSPRGNEVWQYSLKNASVIDAAVSYGGSGVALAVLSLNTATPQTYGYLLDQNGKPVKVGNIGDAVPRTAAISSNGSVAAVGNAHKIIILQAEPDSPNQEIDLKSELQTLYLSDEGKILAFASVIDSGFFMEKNKTDIQVYSIPKANEEASPEKIWSYQLQEALITLTISSNEQAVYITTPQWFKAFTVQGEADWSIEQKDIGALLQQSVVSPSGETVGVLDDKLRMSIWKAPTE